MSIKIAFWSNQLCERGTEIAMYDYAYYNKILLNYESIIFYEKNNKNNNIKVIKKFEKHFQVIGVDNFQDVDDILKQLDINIIYIIKSGSNDGKLSKYAKNIVHCVFTCNEPHGDIYCAVSDWVKRNNKDIITLPHIVSLPYHEETMRKELNIPINAKVFGRHGGYDTFDIGIVHNTIYNIAKNNSNIYFLFLNTKKFCVELPNIIHLNTIIDLNHKRKFINTCDAMIWGRTGGETFGLSIAEFSICNKPVIACKCGDLAHVEFLKDKGMWYNSTNELVKLIVNFKRENIDYNMYKDYTPDKVIKIFDNLIKLL